MPTLSILNFFCHDLDMNTARNRYSQKHKLELLGDISSDIIVRENNENKSFNFLLVTQENINTKEGEKTISQYHKILFPAHLYEYHDVLKKGMRLWIIGKYRIYKWMDNGVEKSSTKVIAKDFFLHPDILMQKDNIGGSKNQGEHEYRKDNNSTVSETGISIGDESEYDCPPF